MLTTSATRNPALVLASGVMGLLFAVQRRASGGIQAPILTHVTWSVLMLRYLPSLFRNPTPTRTSLSVRVVWLAPCARPKTTLLPFLPVETWP